jgi:hypothetical protein
MKRGSAQISGFGGHGVSQGPITARPRELAGFFLAVRGHEALCAPKRAHSAESVRLNFEVVFSRCIG